MPKAFAISATRDPETGVLTIVEPAGLGEAATFEELIQVLPQRALDVYHLDEEAEVIEVLVRVPAAPKTAEPPPIEPPPEAEDEDPHTRSRKRR